MFWPLSAWDNRHCSRLWRWIYSNSRCRPGLRSLTTWNSDLSEQSSVGELWSVTGILRDTDFMHTRTLCEKGKEQKTKAHSWKSKHWTYSRAYQQTGLSQTPCIWPPLRTPLCEKRRCGCHGGRERRSPEVLLSHAAASARFEQESLSRETVQKGAEESGVASKVMSICLASGVRLGGKRSRTSLTYGCMLSLDVEIREWYR